MSYSRFEVPYIDLINKKKRVKVVDIILGLLPVGVLSFLRVHSHSVLYIDCSSRSVVFFKSSIRSRKRNKELDSSEISETNEINEISKSPEDSVVSNEDAPVSSSGYGNCNCHSTTGIHQSSCAEYSDGKWNYASRDRLSSATLIPTRCTNMQTLTVGLLHCTITHILYRVARFWNRRRNLLNKLFPLVESHLHTA